MDKKNKLIFAIFLGIVAVVCVMSNFKAIFFKTAQKGRATAETAKIAQEKLPDRSELMALIHEDADDPAQDILLKAKWGNRNPFDDRELKVPDVVVPVENNVNLVLAGIVSGKIKPSAIVNDKVVGVGERISGWTVKEIKEGVVTLTDGQKETVLKIRQ